VQRSSAQVDGYPNSTLLKFNKFHAAKFRIVGRHSGPTVPSLQPPILLNFLAVVTSMVTVQNQVYEITNRGAQLASPPSTTAKDLSALGSVTWQSGVALASLDVEFGRWALVVGCWLLVVGRWLLGVGCWALVVGRWLLGVGCWVGVFPGFQFSIFVSTIACVLCSQTSRSESRCQHLPTFGNVNVG
jgi:hypothetical protein